MTATRLAALEAVAEAARALAQVPGIELPAPGAEEAFDALDDALAALDALPAEPAQTQTVTLAVWRGANGEVALDIAGSDDDVAYNTTWTRLGTVTLPLTPEGGR